MYFRARKPLDGGKEAAGIYRRCAWCPKCAPSFTLTSSQQSLRLFYMKKSESGVDRPLGRGKSRRQMKIVASQEWASCSGGVWGSSDGHMRKDQWAGDWSTAGGAPSQFPSASRLNTRFTLVDYYVNAQSLCFQEGKKILQLTDWCSNNPDNTTARIQVQFQKLSAHQYRQIDEMCGKMCFRDWQQEGLTNPRGYDWCFFFVLNHFLVKEIKKMYGLHSQT